MHVNVFRSLISYEIQIDQRCCKLFFLVLYVEYGFNVRVSTKGDVYSYGILLLEMFTKKKPTDEMFSKDLNLQRWVVSSLPTMVIQNFHEELEEAYDVEEVKHHLISLLRLCLRCASESPDQRPDMKEVNISIKKIQVLLSQKHLAIQIPCHSTKTN